MDDRARPIGANEAIAGLTERLELGREGADRVVLGIVGPPGSGKSHLAAMLHERLDGVTAGGVAVLAMDGFHLSNTVLEGLGRRDRKGAPDTFDVDGFVATLRRVRVAADPVVYAPRFDRDIGAAIAAASVVAASAGCVVVEGNYLLYGEDGWDRVGPLLDETWYVDTPDDVCVARLLERQTRTYGSLEAAREWVERVDGANAAIVRTTRPRADVLVRTDQR